MDLLEAFRSNTDNDHLPPLPHGEIISTTILIERAHWDSFSPVPDTNDDGLPSSSYLENNSPSPTHGHPGFSPSTPPPAPRTDDDDFPFRLFPEHITTSPIARNTAPEFAGPRQVDGSRTAILHDLGPSVKEISFQFFGDNILPRVPSSIHLPALLRKLQEHKFIVRGRWKAFPRDPFTYAKKSRGSADHELVEGEREKEKAVFAHLAGIIDAIEECIDDSDEEQTERVTSTQYESSPDKVPVCCFDEKAGRPDAYFVFRQRFLEDRLDGRRLWRDIAATAEFKLKDTRETLQDDVKKLCWSLYQILLEDPRRRFVFGFTIENTRMRIWMGNRTEVLVSEPFNFITDHEKLVYFFLSMLYGSETELGLDPTMTIFSAYGNAIPRYDIQVRVVDESTGQIDILTYRTTELINDDGAKSFRGSGTRTWEVIPVVNGVEQPDIRHVLKDHWVDDDRQREGAILDEILNDPDLDDTAREELTELFLTQVARGDVYITDENGEHETVDGTRTLATRGAEIPEGAARFWIFVPADYKTSHETKSRKKRSGKHRVSQADKKSTEGTVRGEAVAIADAEQLSETNAIVYRSKYHHRIVFAQRCKPLSQEQSLRCIFIALIDITSGIAFMHMCGPGWVHRDMSTGNILILLGKRSAKLSDLEYAKRLDSQDKHTLRTGTENFMAVEVDQGAYLFNDQPREIEQVEDHVFDNLAARRKRLRADSRSPTPESATESSRPPTPGPATEPSPSSRPVTQKPFFYNPLHDLESIWWIAVYFATNKETTPASRKRSWSDSTANISYAHLTEDQRDYARSLFSDSGVRSSAIRSSGNTTFDDRLRALPNHLSTIAKELIDLRQIICTRYRQIEQPDFVIDKMVCKPIYHLFVNAFERIVDSLTKQDILVAPLKPNPEEEVRRGVRAAQRALEYRTPSRPAKRRKVVASAATPSTEQPDTSSTAQPKKVVVSTTDISSTPARARRSRTMTAEHNKTSDTNVVEAPTRVTRSRTGASAEQTDKGKGVARASSTSKRRR